MDVMMGKEMSHELGFERLEKSRLWPIMGLSQFEISVAINGQVYYNASLEGKCQRIVFLVP